MQIMTQERKGNDRVIAIKLKHALVIQAAIAGVLFFTYTKGLTTEIDKLHVQPAAAVTAPAQAQAAAPAPK